MTDTTGDEATALRDQLAQLLGDMTVIELKALLLAITEISRERGRDRAAKARLHAGRGKRRRTR
jgi:hypothetical protein